MIEYRTTEEGGVFDIHEDAQLTLVSYEAQPSDLGLSRYYGVTVVDQDGEHILTLSSGYAVQPGGLQYGGFYVGAPNDDSAPSHRHVRNLPDYLYVKRGFKVIVHDVRPGVGVADENDMLCVTIGLLPT